MESWQPHPMSPAALERAREIALAVTSNLGGLGIFGVELFVAGDQVWFSEVSPRPHDTGMVTMITQAQNEFELHARALLGLPVDTSLRQPGASSVIYGGVDAGAVSFHNVAEALAELAPTCACSASPNPSSSAAWAWAWPSPTTWRPRAPRPSGCLPP